MKNKMIILIRPSGSGKRAFAIELTKRHTDYVIVNRDSIRNMTFGY